MEAIRAAWESALGLGAEPRELTFINIAVRGVVVFVFALVMVRLGDKRFLSKKTPFDAILGFILASMLARAVNGSAAFWPTLAGGFVLVGLHRLIAFLARHSHPIGRLVKGSSDVLIREGVIDQRTVRKNDLTPHDIDEDLRLSGVENPEQVRLACVERNGEISVVKKTT